MGQGPSAPGPPDTPFRVIGAGMFVDPQVAYCPNPFAHSYRPRTGTKSFARAISTLLDGPMHDGGTLSVRGAKWQRDHWMEVMQLSVGERSVAERARLKMLLAELMEGYVGTCDAPGSLLYEELMELYPDAKVIVTSRDKESWWRSVLHLRKLITAWWIPYVAWPLPGRGNQSRWLSAQKKMNQARFGGPMTPDTLAEHESRIKQSVPEDKLMFYDVRNGWEPLVEALGVKVPDVPFPHDNKPDDGRKRQTRIFWAGVSAWAVIFATSVGTAAVAYRYAPGVMRYLAKKVPS